MRPFSDVLELTDIPSLTFSAGERHPRLKVDGPCPPLRAVIDSSDRLLDLLLVADILRRTETILPPLILPYVPYGRQDRATTADSAFSLKVFADLLNAQGFPAVHIFEPHSDVSPAVLDNCRVHYQDAAVRSHAERLRLLGHDRLLLFAPDAGASKRTARAADACGELALPDVGQALKHRNPATGKLEITYVSANVAERDVLVVDDLCDGGATFLHLAEALAPHRPRSLHLFVGHGIFSKGTDELRRRFTTIASTDSRCRAGENPWGDAVTVYPSI